MVPRLAAAPAKSCATMRAVFQLPARLTLWAEVPRAVSPGTADDFTMLVTLLNTTPPAPSAAGPG